jgi:hypothetical protein
MKISDCVDKMEKKTNQFKQEQNINENTEFGVTTTFNLLLLF